MSKVRVLLCATALSGAIVGTLSSAFAQEERNDQLARTVVSTSATIKPGDVVVISGGRHTIPLMEAVAIEAQKAGGMVTMFLTTDRVVRSFNADVPEKYLDQAPRFLAEWLKHVDVFIGLPNVEDPQASIAGVPEARFAKAAKAGEVVSNILNASPVRGVFIGYPSSQEAAANRLDFATYEKMHWDGIAADYNQISEKGKTLRNALKGAKSVRITSPNGTDFTFSVGNRPIFVDDGIITPEKAKSKLIFVRTVTLPTGQVFFAPIETSANGKVVVPKNQCRYAPLTETSFEFKNGKMENFKAKDGLDCFNETMTPYSGPKDILGFVSIGLNPALKVIEDGGDYRPGNAAGMVWIGTGQNELYGGNNKPPGGFGFPIVKSTVQVDGKTVVKDGELTL